jgi:hypothetical protein
MNTRTIAAGALIVVTAGIATAANAWVAVPASYVEGIVQAVDHEARTLTVANTKYQVRSLGELNEVNAGDKVDVTFLNEAGRNVAIAVTLR